VKLRRLLARNVLYHWRGNLAVLLGVAVSTAVLTGALLVGDSLRGSLQDLTLRQLGWVDHALVANRFVRAELADELQNDHAAERICPAIVLQGSASRSVDNTKTGETFRAGRVMILGVDDRFWPENGTSPGASFWRPESVDLGAGQVVLNSTLAQELHADKGKQITLYLPKTSAVPRETILGKRDKSQVMATLNLTVAEVLPDDHPGAQFNLTPSPSAPRNVFVPLALLQAKLDQEAKRDKLDLHMEDRVNALLARGQTEELQTGLHKRLKLDDWGLILRDPESRTRDLFIRLASKLASENPVPLLTRLASNPQAEKLVFRQYQRRVPSAFAKAVDRDHDRVLTWDEVLSFYQTQRSYLSLESRQLLLENFISEAALATATAQGLKSAPTIIYLADSLATGENKTNYALVSAVDPALPPPLGPFLPSGVTKLEDRDIVLVEWKQPLLAAKPGALVKMSYYDPEDQDQLRAAEFRLRGFLPVEGVARDSDLTPDFPGITDVPTMEQWEPPPQLHFDNKRVEGRDEQFWDEFRTTPKAYITLKRGKELWGKSRFGTYTSIRLAPEKKEDLTKSASAFQTGLLERLNPEQGGLVFDPVAQRRLEAANGGTDFGELFLSFSFFLIAAALLLVGLLFRLNLDRRAQEIGVLFAAGYRRRTVGLLLLGEGAVLAAGGALLGSAGALVYAKLLLDYLRAQWPGGLSQSFLSLHTTWTSFVLGYGASLLVSVLTIAWAVFMLSRVAPRALLTGETEAEPRIGRALRRPRASLWVSSVTLVLGLSLVLTGRLVKDAEMQASAFFGGGAMLLTSALAGLWAWLRGNRPVSIRGHGGLALARLGIRNAPRHPVRSLLTAGLLAAATFVIVAVQAFHREPGSDFLQQDSGSGGCALLAEADVPLFQDLNKDEARRYELNFPAASTAALHDVAFFPFRVRAGDDASCLNLYQPRRPRILGVPTTLIERGGFKFADVEVASDAERKNPWLLLKSPDADAVPAIADATTVQWMLHSKLGGIVEVPDSQGNLVKLRIVALLQESVFQSELLVADDNFLRLYPREEGYTFFLIQTPPDRTPEVKNVLENALADHGFYVTPTAQRLASYLAVENTYLSTFQALGGLGLLLGALGLAVVLLRSVWERLGEMALLRALGYRHGDLGWLVLAENAFLLIAGLAAGTLAAAAAVAPQLLGAPGGVHWLGLVGLLGLVLATGLLAGAGALASLLRAPLVPALRRE
jgi:ABC-type antimicrobial peptide transport system permease subunit